MDRLRAQDMLSEHFKSMRLRTSETPEGLEIKAGSDAIFRLLGFLGTNSLPVGLTIKLEEENGRTAVKSTAFDRLGWYVNDRGVFGTQEALEQKLESLLVEVRSAFGEDAQSNRV